MCMRHPLARILVASLLLLWGQMVSAQSSNSDPCGNGYGGPEPLDDRFIGVCGLDGGTHPLSYNEGSTQLGSIDFSIRSCHTYWGTSCENARKFTVEIAGPSAGGAFVLSGPAGDVPVRLTLVHAVSGAETLAPDTESSTHFAGGANGQQIPVSLQLTLPSTAALTPGVYSGNFSFYVYQCETWEPWGICKGSTWSGRTELNPPVQFSVQLVAGTLVRISGLEDLVIDSDTSGNIDAQQRFCVYASSGARFNVRADSRNGTDAFVLKGTNSGDTIGYQLRMESLLPPHRPAWLSEGQLSSQGWKGSPQIDCLDGNGENMQLTVRIPSSELRNPQDNQYTDTVTLTVEIE